MKRGIAGALAIFLTIAFSAIAAEAAPFGAIATSGYVSGGAWGLARNRSTLANAESRAIVACRSEHRGACGVRMWWSGPGVCGALAQNGSRFGWGYARGIAAARINALRGAYGGVVLIVGCNGI